MTTTTIDGMIAVIVATVTVVQLHLVAEEKNAHPLVPSLVLEAAEVMEAEMPDLAEMISESAIRVLVDNRKGKVKVKMDQTDEELRWVFRTLVEDENPPTVVLSEREIELLNARLRQRPLRNAEQLVCQSK